MIKLIADITIRTDKTDHWKGQSETSRRLSEMGVHKRRWMMSSSNGTHKWRCWITDEQLTAVSLIAESVNLDFNEQLLAKRVELESKISLIDAVLDGKIVDFDDIQDLLNG